jgi:hypothetical protein
MIKINLNPIVERKLRSVHKKGGVASFRQSINDLLKGKYEINVPMETMKRVEKALQGNKGITLSMSQSDLNNNPQIIPAIALGKNKTPRNIKGGFLPALIGAMPLIASAFAALASGTAAAKNVRDLVKGKGFDNISDSDINLITSNLHNALSKLKANGTSPVNVISSLAPLVSSSLTTALKARKGGSMRLLKKKGGSLRLLQQNRKSKNGGSLRLLMGRGLNIPRGGGHGKGLTPHGFMETRPRGRPRTKSI